MMTFVPHAAGRRHNGTLPNNTDDVIRIGFVMHQMQVAGAEMLVSEIIRAMPADMRATVFCLDAVGSLGEQLQQAGTEVICLERRAGLDLPLAVRLSRAASSRQIHILHSHQYTPFFYSALARLMGCWRTRLIFTEHGRHYPDVVSVRRRLANRWILRRLATDVNACCQFAASAVRANDGFTDCDVRVIYNGVEPTRYARTDGTLVAKQAAGLAPDRRYVAMVARFHPVKDHKTVVRGFGLLAARHPDVDLLLVGEGPERAAVEGLVRSLKLTDRVHFLGVRSDIPQLLSASDVFTLTSVSEAASLTLLEAMASGLPVIVTDVGGNSELVTHGVEGLLIPRGDAPAFAHAAGTVLNNQDTKERMGNAGRRRVEMHFALANTLQAYLSLYRCVAAKRGKSATAVVTDADR